MGIEFRVLGPLEVVCDQRVTTPPGPKRRALLAVLLAFCNETVSTYKLIEALWDSSPPATATTTLRCHATRVRQALSGDRLHCRPPGYQLEVRSGELDLHRFDALVAYARRKRENGQLAEAGDTFRAALALWRGQVFEEVESPLLHRIVVPPLLERRLAALEDRIDIDLRLHSGTDLVAELIGLVAEHPFRERLHGQLMIAFYRTGRRAEALRVFRSMREILTDELGVEPGPALQRPHQAILAGSPAEELLPT